MWEGHNGDRDKVKTTEYKIHDYRDVVYSTGNMIFYTITLYKVLDFISTYYNAPLGSFFSRQSIPHSLVFMMEKTFLCTLRIKFQMFEMNEK